jgi:pimeloyl-ACP methyl ester carboxylesterase
MKTTDQIEITPSISSYLPGGPGNGTNPRRLSAAGWSAFFPSPMKQVASKMNVKLALLVASALTVSAGQLQVAAAASPVKNVVLVHGAFVDGSGWKGVYEILKKDGYNVKIVQTSTKSLEGDVAATKQVIDTTTGDVLVVGHSYGGAVITEAGNDPKVAGLVYVAAFAPDAGESVGGLNGKPAPDATNPPMLPPQNGSLTLDRSGFQAAFAADVDPVTAGLMADSQVPLGLEALSGTITHPAWKDKPSWYIITTRDKIVPLSLQRTMAERANAHIKEIAASHAVYISKAKAVAKVIEEAAQNVGSVEK